MTHSSKGNVPVLIVGPAWVGDMVLAQSMFKALRQSRANVEIDVIAPPWSKPLLQRMPEVRATIELAIGHGQLGLGMRVRIGRSLRDHNYQQAYVLPRSFKSALIPFIAKIPVRTGYKGETRYGVLNDIRQLDKQALPTIVSRYINLVVPYKDKADISTAPRPSLTVDPNNQNLLVVNLKLTRTKPVIGFVPGAEFGLSKQWPPEYFSWLGKQLIQDGYQIWIFGSNKDLDTGRVIEQNIDSSDVVNLCGKTKLEDVIDLISLTALVVTNDSGLMHIAVATGRRAVVFYGATTPEYTPPLTDQARVLYRNLECSPCWEKTCRYGHYRCLRDITAQQAYAVCKELL